MSRAVVTAQPGELRAAVLDDDGALTDFLVERGDRPEVVGNRYLGRVSAYDSGLQAAFVDVGLDRPGFLPRKAMHAPLSDGDRVVVEVVRAPSPGKGAKLTAPPGQSGTVQGDPPLLLSASDTLAAMLTRHDPREVRVGGTLGVAALRRRIPAVAERMVGEPGGGDLFQAEGLDEALDSLLAPEVPLPGGGLLRIEPVATLTAVDVDAAAHEGRGDAARLVREVNMAAARELVRQIRLRALSGLIVVDFLEMESKAERRAVTEVLESALGDEPGGSAVAPMRASGLVEIARQRLRTPLHELLTEPGGQWGAGWIKTPEAVAFELLRRAESEVRARPSASVALVVAPSVAAALEGGAARAARQALEQRLGGPLAIRAEAAMSRETYDIVLG